MKSPLECQVLLPFTVDTHAKRAVFPALQALLRHARPLGRTQGGIEHWLCQQFEVPMQQDTPSAPFAALGTGLAAEQGYWLHADPVSLVLQRDSFSLMEAPVELQHVQAEALAATLNAHFAPDGMQFYVASSRHWYIRLNYRPALQTHALAQVLGRDIQPWLPKGEDGLNWHRWLNEVQMLLHAHPVNTTLEQQGHMPVNSVWVWGGGEYAPGKGLRREVWSADALSRGLAMAHESRHHALPVSAEGWLEAADPALPQLIVLPAFDPEIDQQWLAPLMAGLRHGKIATIDMHIAGLAHVSGYTLRRRDLLKFWRRSRPLESYLG